MKTILLVDDEYAITEILSELLEDEGYRVVSAANGKDALVRLQTDKPDLLITDFMMPIGNGGDLVRAMRALADFQDTPVVMMSATAKSVALSDPSGRLKVTAFIKKPFEWEKLLDVIVQLIGGPEKTVGSPSR